MLRTVCSANADPEVTSSARADLVKKLGSKTALGEYVKALTSRCVGRAGDDTECYTVFLRFVLPKCWKCAFKCNRCILTRMNAYQDAQREHDEASDGSDGTFVQLAYS